MKARIMLLAALALLWCSAANAAQGICTGSQSIAQISVQLKAAGDISTGRHYLSIQNIGPVVLCCGIGTSNAVLANCTNGFMLVPTQMWSPAPAETSGNVSLPDGDMSCIAPTGTGSATACDF